MKIVFNGYFYKNEKLKVTQAVKIFSKNFKISRNFHFTVHSLNESESKKLNQKTFNKNKPTDVLSFPLYNDIEAINELATYINQLKNIGKDGYGLFAFDKSFEKLIRAYIVKSFPDDGIIGEEFKEKKQDLIEQVHNVLNEALEGLGRKKLSKPLNLLVTAQGGVGTANEHQLLLDNYNVDLVGWGTPFLLVPEAVNIDKV